MSAPLTIIEATDQGLTVADVQGIFTFSNGSEYEQWADGNCWQCRYYVEDGAAGELCAFEGAALLGIVSPALARLFGWVQDPKWDEPDDHRSGWDAPHDCPFREAKQ